MLVAQASQNLRHNDAYQTDLIRKTPYFEASELFSERSFSSHYSPELHGRITLWIYILKFVNQWLQTRKKNMMNRSHVFLTSVVVVLVSVLFMYSGFLLALKISDKESNILLSSELVSHKMEQVSYVPEFDPFSPYVAAPVVRQHQAVHNQMVQKNQSQFQVRKMHPQRSLHAVERNNKPVMRHAVANRGSMNNLHQNNRFAAAPVKMRYVPNTQVMYVPGAAQTKTSMNNAQRPRRNVRNNIPPQSVPNRIFQTNQRPTPSMTDRSQQRRKISRSQKNQYQSNRNNQSKRQQSNLNTLPKNSPLPQNFVPPVLQ